MRWTDLLNDEIHYNYMVADKLLDMVDDDSLGWKPESGDNWMTTGQLVMHITNACGASCKGFVTGDWGLPEGVSMDDMSPDEMLPPAEAMPTVEGVAQAKELLAADKEVALAMVAQAGEDALENQSAPAPWDPSDVKLGHRLLSMVGHLNNHKGQLYYYLKLQGKPVNTMHYYGM